MAKLRLEKDRYIFFCPGCKEIHQPNTGWKFNGNFDVPTLAPSVLVRSGHHVDNDKTSCWCAHNAERIAKGEEPSGFECTVCHSFVRDGRIEFLSDCTHSLAGQTVDLPVLEAGQY